MSMYKKHYPTEIILNVYYGGRANKNWIEFMPINDLARLQETKEFLGMRCKLIAEQLLGPGSLIHPRVTERYLAQRPSIEVRDHYETQMH